MGIAHLVDEFRVSVFRWCCGDQLKKTSLFWLCLRIFFVFPLIPIGGWFFFQMPVCTDASGLSDSGSGSLLSQTVWLLILLCVMVVRICLSSMLLLHLDFATHQCMAPPTINLHIFLTKCGVVFFTLQKNMACFFCPKKTCRTPRWGVHRFVRTVRILSLHAAWESVQHTFCGKLADELRVREIRGSREKGWEGGVVKRALGMMMMMMKMMMMMMMMVMVMMMMMMMMMIGGYDEFWRKRKHSVSCLRTLTPAIQVHLPAIWGSNDS